MRIGIIGAMEVEISILRENIGDETINVNGIDYFVGHLGKNEIIICKCGMGKVNASISATIMIKEFDVDVVINTGIAGGYMLPCETVVLAKSLRYHDVEATIFGYRPGQVPGMPYEYLPSADYSLLLKKALNNLGVKYVEENVYTGDQFITDVNKIISFDKDKPAAFEMEGAAVAQSCMRLGVDFVTLRFISDDVLHPNQEMEYLKFEEKMANLSANICLNVLKEFN